MKRPSRQEKIANKESNVLPYNVLTKILKALTHSSLICLDTFLPDLGESYYTVVFTTASSIDANKFHITMNTPLSQYCHQNVINSA